MNCIHPLVSGKFHSHQVTDKISTHLYFSSDGVNKIDVSNIQMPVVSTENVGYLDSISLSKILEKIVMQCCISDRELSLLYILLEA